MWAHWTTMLIASAILLVVGLPLWLDAATTLVRVVAPSSSLAARQSRLCVLGGRMAIAGLALALVGGAVAIVDLIGR